MQVRDSILKFQHGRPEISKVYVHRLAKNTVLPRCPGIWLRQRSVFSSKIDSQGCITKKIIIREYAHRQHCLSSSCKGIEKKQGAMCPLYFSIENRLYYL